MKAATNAETLITQVLAGEVWPPLADRHGYRVGPTASRSRCQAWAA